MLGCSEICLGRCWDECISKSLYNMSKKYETFDNSENMIVKQWVHPNDLIRDPERWKGTLHNGSTKKGRKKDTST